MKISIAWTLSILNWTTAIARAKASALQQDPSLLRNGQGLEARFVLLSDGLPWHTLSKQQEQTRRLARRSSEGRTESPDQHEQDSGSQELGSQTSGQGTGAATQGAEASRRSVDGQQGHWYPPPERSLRASQEHFSRPSPFQHAQGLGVGRPPSQNFFERPVTQDSQALPMGAYQSHSSMKREISPKGIEKQGPHGPITPGVSLSKDIPSEPEKKHQNTPPLDHMLGQVQKLSESRQPSAQSNHEDVQLGRTSSPRLLPDSSRRQLGSPGTAGLRPSPEDYRQLSNMPESWRKSYLKHTQSQGHQPVISPTDWSRIKKMDRQDSRTLAGTLRIPPKGVHLPTSATNFPHLSQQLRQTSLPRLQPKLLGGQRGQHLGIERHMSISGFEPALMRDRYDQYLRAQGRRGPQLSGNVVQKINTADRELSGSLPHAISVPLRDMPLSTSPSKAGHSVPLHEQLPDSRDAHSSSSHLEAGHSVSLHEKLRDASPQAQVSSSKQLPSKNWWQFTQKKNDDHNESRQPLLNTDSRPLRKRASEAGVSGDESEDKQSKKRGDARKGGESGGLADLGSGVASGKDPQTLHSPT